MKAKDVFARLSDLLRLIRKANGFRTNAGLSVHFAIQGMPAPEDLTVPAIFVAMDGLSWDSSQYSRALVTLRFSISGAVAVDSPMGDLLDLAWDIRAACSADGAFAGLLHGANAVQFSEARFQLPENGNNLAEVSQPVSFTFAEHYKVN